MLRICRQMRCQMFCRSKTVRYMSTPRRWHSIFTITTSGGSPTPAALLSEETVGDLVELENSSGKVLEGAVEQMDIDLTGGFIAKAVIRGNGKSDL